MSESQDKTNFSADMSADELEIGERSHLEIEKHRRLVMAIGLTKESSELKEVLSNDPDSYLNALSLAKDAIAHYTDVIELLTLSSTKLRTILEEELQQISDDLSDDQKNRIIELLNDGSSNPKH